MFHEQIISLINSSGRRDRIAGRESSGGRVGSDSNNSSSYSNSGDFIIGTIAVPLLFFDGIDFHRVQKFK